MLTWLKSLFGSTPSGASEPTELPASPTEEFVWCLVGNIIVSRKQFSANTKVYCLRTGWGDGFEYIKVIGQHKKSKKLVQLILQTKHIHHWRKQKVYRPQVIKMMKEQKGLWQDEKWIDSLAEQFNKPE